MVVKINISLPEELLGNLDQAARESNSSRSSFLVQAVKYYLAEKESEQKRERQHQAAKEIDRVRESVEPWDATGEVLKWRSLH